MEFQLFKTMVQKIGCFAAFTLVVSVCCVVTRADITVNRVFSDHMVLQQNSTVSIWGTADAGEKIRVSFNSQNVEVTATADGKWTADLKTPAAGGPFQIEVAAVDGDPKIILEDVLVGEVWICSGQSNMEWPITKADYPEREIDAAKEYSSVRLFTVEKNTSQEPLSDFNKVVGWNVCSPETVKEFSAVGYFFGRKLNDELNIPIGLINSSWGGTPCEAWVSKDALRATGAFDPMLKHWEEIEDKRGPNYPANLYNAMIAPLKGFAFQGAIWYQGESNVGRGVQYKILFPTMIEDWRRNLAGGKAFPFLFVQIAPYRYGNQAPNAMPEVWDAQLHTYRWMEHVGMVVTTDIANIGDIHPKNKQDVGSRLANWALSDCYREFPRKAESLPVVVPSGPLYRSKLVDGNKVRLLFDFVADGLSAKDGKELTDFAICGSDGNFVAAKAEIQNDTVVVWADDVAEPTEVRFAWTDTAQPNLFNSAGLPASPFRTDSFPLSSEGVNF